MFDYKTRLAEAERKREDAAGALTEAEAEEIRQREEVAKIEAEAATLASEKRELDLTHREEKAAGRYGKHVRGLVPTELDDTFVVRAPDSSTYRAYLQKLRRASDAKKDLLDVHVEFACAVVCDWNGIDDLNHAMMPDGKNAAGAALGAFLKAHPAVAILIANLSQELGGASAADRKSAR